MSKLAKRTGYIGYGQKAISQEQADDLKAALFGGHKSGDDVVKAIHKIHGQQPESETDGERLV